MRRTIAAESATPARGRPRRRIRAAVAVAAGAVTLAAGSVGLVGSTAGATEHRAATTQSEHQVQRDVIANLWEWNWVSIARECTTVLGPKGYGGVQVAPPQDSLSKTDGPVHPWWEVYQPVDYNLTSRMGNEEQFKSMVADCRNAGVQVYVDAVINHMTGQGNISYGGVSYAKYEYAGLYSDSSNDFHHGECPQSDGTIHDFNNFTEVTECELVGLSDLRTESDAVRTDIADYLN